MAYWDTSALLKLYVAEPDSSYFLNLVAAGQDQILSATITTMEVLCALYRKQQAGDLKAGGAEAIFGKFTADIQAGRLLTVPFGAGVLAQAEDLLRAVSRQPTPVMIRSLDLIHAASALAAKARLMVATDARLRQLAAQAGMKLLP